MRGTHRRRDFSSLGGVNPLTIKQLRTTDSILNFESGKSDLDDVSGSSQP